jgi:protoheme IX farnesyltransferase
MTVSFHKLAISCSYRIRNQSKSLQKQKVLYQSQTWKCFSTNPPSESSNHKESSSSSFKNAKSIAASRKEDKEITATEYVKTISELSKARLSALVVSTSSFGYLAAATPISYSTLAAASLGTALCSSSASTLNQIFEIDRDARMKRTAQRPLVTQHVLGANGAYALAATTGLTGGATLYFGTDPITTALGVGNIALYAGAYTYLKPRSEWNTWVGAIVGAIPPVMGYTAATKGLGLFDIEAALLGGTLFLWQFPHFFALSWMHRVDYARGGFQVRTFKN